VNPLDPPTLVSGPGFPLRGEASLPGDKSLSHRAALLAAMAEGESRIENFLVAGVTRAMLRALSSLGVSWELDGTVLAVSGHGPGGFLAPTAPLDCGNSATTLRLLAGALAAAGIPAVLDGSPGLRSRPMARITEPLQAMGVPLEAAAGGAAPLRFSARPPGLTLRGIEHHLVVASAQVKSCLLLAGLAAEGSTVLHEPGMSRDHTERMLRGLGVSVETVQSIPEPLPRPAVSGRAGSIPAPLVTTTLIPPRPLSLPPLRFSLPGDFSSAAFLMVAALIVPGSEITLRAVGLNPARTGLLDVLKAMGAGIQVLSSGDLYGEPIGDLLVRSGPLRAVDVSGPLVARMIDEFPVFAVAAALAEGRTTVRDAGELRHKESDRISALSAELRALGVDILETAGGFEIQGGSPLRGGAVRAHGDHRLAMALAVAGLAAAGPVVVRGAGIIAESFPGFLQVMNHLGAPLRMEG
jgi:3-phosphoshikimate 1-carboxyvinyltransferase